MTINLPLVIFLISYIAALFALTLGFVSYFLYRESIIRKDANRVLDNSAEILKESHERARILLKESSEKASQLLHQATFSDEVIKKHFEQFLKDAVENTTTQFVQDSQLFLTEYKKSLDDIRSEYINQLQKMIKDIKSSTDTELQTFKETLQKDALASEGSFGQRVADDLKTVHQELDDYKKSQIEHIDELIKKRITQLSEQVLSKSIPIEEHEDLIITALNRAKEEGLFNE